MRGVVQDLRYELRQLAKSPGFTAVGVLTLAIAIGATTSVFSVTDALILKPLPYADPERLVNIYATDPDRGATRTVVSGATYLDWRAQAESFEAIAAHRRIDMNLVGTDYPVRVLGASVTPDFFEVLGVEAALGRVLSSELDAPEVERAVVLGDALWRSRFGADPGVLGRTLTLNDVPYVVVGVMPPGFAFPATIELYASSPFRVPQMPISGGADPSDDRGNQYLSVIARLRTPVDIAQAQAEMAAIAEQIAEAYPETSEGEGVAVVSLHEDLIGDTRPMLQVLMGAVGFVLLIACANVANLLLVRSYSRQQELALRLALGASPRRIRRQLLTESLLLAACGGAAGVLAALWGTDAILALAPETIPRVAEIGVDWRVLAFAALVVTCSGVLFGVGPALQLSGSELEQVIKDGTGQTPRARRGPSRRLLIVCEVAVSLLLLVGAGLMLRTFLVLVSVDPGFDPENVLTAHIALAEQRYLEEPQMAAFYGQLMGRLQALPGVESAAAVLTLPISWNLRGTFNFGIEGRAVETGEPTASGYQVVTPDYFRTLGIPVRRGRGLEPTDDADAPGVALINEALAELYWPDADPIGERITWDEPDSEDADWWTIVGVVGNTSLEGLDRPAVPETYRAYAQAPLPFATLVIRAKRPLGLEDAVRRVVLETDRELPIYGVRTLDDVVAESMGDRLFNVSLLSAFAVAALLMAAIGLYGVVSSTVARRTHEIGVRRALGATERKVVAQVIREGWAPVVPGLVIGGATALALTRFISSQVYGISPIDPVSYAIGALLLAVIALLACYVPARRAAQIDPLAAMRS